MLKLVLITPVDWSLDKNYNYTITVLVAFKTLILYFHYHPFFLRVFLVYLNCQKESVKNIYLKTIYFLLQHSF